MPSIPSLKRGPVSFLLVATLLFAFALLLTPQSVGAQGGTADVWLAHLSPFAPSVPATAVDVEVTAGGSTITIEDVQYKDTSEMYLPLPEGDIDVTVYLAGTSTAVLQQTLSIVGGEQYTIVAIGGANGWPVELLLLEDDNTPPGAGQGKVRIGHLAPFADTAAGTAIDLRLQNGNLLPGFGDIQYKDLSQYLPLPATTLDLIITAPGGAPILYDLPPFDIVAGTVSTVFAIGDMGNQPLEVITIQTYPVSPPTAVTLTDLSSSADGSYGWLLALGLTAVGAAVLVRRRLA